jgi:hypothetical protein
MELRTDVIEVAGSRLQPMTSKLETNGSGDQVLAVR